MALHGNAELIADLAAAVRRPRWPLFFGRKAFVPASPLIGTDGHSTRPGTGIVERPLPEVLATHPWLENRSEQRHQVSPADGAELLRTVVDVPASDPEAELRHDHPLSFANDDRRFVSRTVRVGHVVLTEAMKGAEACS